MTSQRCGALVVGGRRSLLPALREAAKLVKDVLYVPLDHSFPNSAQPPSSSSSSQENTTSTISVLVDSIRQAYHLIASTHPHLDLRFILPPPPLTTLTPHPPPLQHKVGVVFSPLHSLSAVEQSSCFKVLSQRIELSSEKLKDMFQHLNISEEEGGGGGGGRGGGGGSRGGGGDGAINGDGRGGGGMSVEEGSSVPPKLTQFDHVALGGTFDLLHTGHRLLLTESALLSRKRLLVGVATGPLLESKILPELIASYEEREAAVRGLLEDTKWWITHDVVPISDVYGPTAWDGDLQCLVLTADTARGGAKVNSERSGKGLSPLSIHTVDLVGEEGVAVGVVSQEDKLSSSALRRSLLGHHRTPTINDVIQYDVMSGPYLIGLTGAMATGKSSVMLRLVKLGAYPIDCDKLGHDTYKPGGPAYDQIIGEFGEGVRGEGGEVDRRALGAIVFSDESKLQRLNDIVWPEIWRLVEERVREAHRHGYQVCVVDAAVLLQAGWHRRVHEVWATVAPREELVCRVMERNGLSEEATRSRLSAQPSGQEYADHAHIIIGTQWAPEVTKGQVEGAWQEVIKQLGVTIATDTD